MEELSKIRPFESLSALYKAPLSPKAIVETQIKILDNYFKIMQLAPQISFDIAQKCLATATKN